MSSRSVLSRLVAVCLMVGLTASCSAFQSNQTTQPSQRTTSRDKTAKGAGIGAAAGAVLGAVLGEGEADEILAGAAVGAGIGAGVGAYMDHQEEKLARIPGTTVERVGKDMLLVHFNSDILFEINSAILSPSSRTSLSEVANVLMEYPKTAIVIQGHTDSTGSEVFNQQLSERRASSVAGHLLGRGLEAERVAVVGYGEGRPVAENTTLTGRQLNRRVNILLKAKAT